jgi:DNA-directed RNA polymerase subunit RPC12/RpoP
MINHTCGSSIYIDISDSVLFITSYGISKGILKIGTGTILFKSSTAKAKFYCSNCEKIVNKNELRITCMHCGGENLIQNIRFFTDSGSVFCLNCIELYYKLESNIPLNLDDIKIQ